MGRNYKKPGLLARHVLASQQMLYILWCSFPLSPFMFSPSSLSSLRSAILGGQCGGGSLHSPGVRHLQFPLSCNQVRLSRSRLLPDGRGPPRSPRPNTVSGTGLSFPYETKPKHNEASAKVFSFSQQLTVTLGFPFPCRILELNRKGVCRSIGSSRSEEEDPLLGSLSPR